MMRRGVVVFLAATLVGVAAQEATCFSSGSVAGAVLGTLLVCLLLLAAWYALLRFYWRNRREVSCELSVSTKEAKGGIIHHERLHAPVYQDEEIEAAQLQNLFLPSSHRSCNCMPYRENPRLFPSVTTQRW
uniref:Uncharacterized protein n=1 Tax=Timema tahoe TaxID=61484 RepID=A0A7R9IEL2_9NEOP|nr:unnamed protein product [Timema tahoe]